MKYLLLITGSPRSGTTWFHNALILSGVFNGVPADDYMDKSYVTESLYTDEFYPSIAPAIYWLYRKNPLSRLRYLISLNATIRRLYKRFRQGDRLMLKAPHYVFGLGLYNSLFKDRLRIIFVYRDPFEVAWSMFNFPHIRSQVEKDINNCTDFVVYRNGRSISLPLIWARSDVLEEVKATWYELSLVERCLFVWHLYANAFLSNYSKLKGAVLVVDYYRLNEERKIRRLADFVETPISRLSFLRSDFEPSRRKAISLESLSEAGKSAWKKMECIKLELDRMCV